MCKGINLYILKILFIILFFNYQSVFAKVIVNTALDESAQKITELDQKFEADKSLAKTVMKAIRTTIFETKGIDTHDLTLFKNQVIFLEQLFENYRVEYKDISYSAREVIKKWEAGQSIGSVETMRVGVKLFSQSHDIVVNVQTKLTEIDVLLSEVNLLLVDIFNRRVSVSDRLLFSNVTSFYHINTWQVAFEDISTHVQGIIYDIKHVDLQDEGLPGVGTWLAVLLAYLILLNWVVKYSYQGIKQIRRLEKKIDLKPIYQVSDVVLKGLIPTLFIYFAVEDITNPGMNKYDNIVTGLIFSLVCAINFSILFYVCSVTLVYTRVVNKRIWFLVLSFLTFIVLLNNNINPFLFSTQFYPFIGIYGVAAINLIIVLILTVMGLIYVYLHKGMVTKYIHNKQVAQYVIWIEYLALLSAPVIIFFGYSNLIIGFIINIVQTAFCIYFVYLCYKILTTFLFLGLVKCHEYILKGVKHYDEKNSRRVRRSYVIRWIRFLIIILSIIAGLVLIALFWGVPPLSIENFFDIILFEPFPIGDNENFSMFSIFYAIIILLICYSITMLLTSLVERQILRHTLATAGTKYAIKMSMKYLGIIISVVVFVYALGVDTSSMTFVISGLSIGVGFALKDTLSNFFLGILALMTRYVRAGDWVYTTDESIQGTIEHIGLHSTIIRAFNQRPIIVPNSQLMSQALVNASRMTNRRILQYIGVRYDDLHLVPNILKEIKKMLSSHQDIDQTQTTLVNLVDGNTDGGCYGDYSINFMVYTYTKTTNWVEFQNIQDEIMLKIGEIIESIGAEIAFPTSTLFFNKKN
jgi:small-conductance mechanosensitive channel